MNDPLSRLAERVREDLDLVSYPTVPWIHPETTPDGEPVLDCLVIGGGQYGLALAFALRREQVENVLVLDENPAGSEGPWVTFARMETLRTPKTLTGPDLGLPSLTFRAWCDARHGAGTWDGLGRIPRAWWMEYLIWYREVLALPVRNRSRVTDIRPVGRRLFAVDFDEAGSARRLFARTIILATGTLGSGEVALPPILQERLPRDRFAHAIEPIDFARLAGKRLGILGAGASAFDNAATALEAGAATADVFFRRPAMPLDNPRRWMEFSGFLAHYPELSDARRWAYMHRLYAIGQPPPVNTYERATALPGFTLHAGSPWLDVALAAGDPPVEVVTPKGRFRFDFLIAASGIAIDLRARPELRHIVDHIATWSMRYEPPPDLRDVRLSRFPYLGRYGELTEAVPGSAPWTARIFAIFRGATMSLGPSAASNSNMKYTIPRLVSGVTRQLVLDAEDAHWATFTRGDHAELEAVAET
jgi:cation diffusion facilitator CzcD-associated flavoprotein CzcO